MADELAVVIKTKLEIDEQQLRRDIDDLGSGNNAIKVPVEADKDTFSKSLDELRRNPSPITVKVDTDNIIRTIRDKLNSANFSIKVDTDAIAEAVAGAAGAASRKKKKTASAIGIDPNEIAGSQKYVDKLVEKANQFKQSFSDASAKIVDTQIVYKPLEKMYQASVRYEDSIGRTTSMVFSLNEGMEEIRVTQLKLADNEKKYRTEVEKNNKAREAEMKKTLDYLGKQESIYNDLVSRAFNQKNKLSDDNGTPDAFGLVAKNALDSYKTQIDEIRNQGAAITAEQKRNLAKLESDARRIITEQQTAKWGATDFASKDVSKQIELEQKKLKTLIREYKDSGLSLVESVKKLDSLELGLGGISNIDELNKWRESLKLAKADIEDFFSTTNGKAFQLSLDINDDQIAQIDRLLSYEAIGKGNTDGISRLREELEKLKELYISLKTALSSPVETGVELSIADLKEYNDKLAIADQRLASAAKQAKLFNGSIASNDALEKADRQIEKLKNDLESMEVNWSKALEIPELKADIDQMRSALDRADAANLSNLQRSFTELRSKIKAAGADCKSFGGQCVDAFNKLKGYFSVTEVFQYIKEGVDEVIQAVKEVDTAMTELRKVTNLSESGYDQFTKEAAGRAKEIGTSVSDYINSAADFSRLGFGFEDADTMAYAANIYYKVGDQIASIEEATQSLVSTTQAYGLTANDALTIVDKLNSAGNSLAISSGGLGTALQKSAAALAAGNNTLDESIALIAAANRVAQNPDAVGNMWKTVSMRIRSAKVELEEAGEDTDGLIESTAELQAMIKGMTGFDILEADQKTFKSTYDIVVGIAEKWSSLEDIQQASLLEALAGKRQGNYLAATLTNMADLQKSMNVTQSSAGSAMTEHERWMQSIEASEARATAAFQQFSNTVMSSDLIKGAYDMQTGILGFLTNIVEKLGAIPALAATVAGDLSFKKNIGISNMNMPCPTCYGAAA